MKTQHEENLNSVKPLKFLKVDKSEQQPAKYFAKPDNAGRWISNSVALLRFCQTALASDIDPFIIKLHDNKLTAEGTAAELWITESQGEFAGEVWRESLATLARVLAAVSERPVCMRYNGHYLYMFEMMF
jgi:hypothetical protein